MSLEEDHIGEFIKEGTRASKSKGVSNMKVAKEVLKTGTAAGAAVSAATGLTVAELRGQELHQVLQPQVELLVAVWLWDPQY